MRIIEVLKNFAYAHMGIHVETYRKGDVVEVSDECADLAIKQKWAKASKGAPENKAAQDPETLD